jgi:PAS domain S-box-containing protein
MMSGGMTNPILESALDAVVGMDRFGRITDFLAAENLFGHSREEVLGKLLAGYITKPIGIESLPKVVAGYLALARSAR